MKKIHLDKPTENWNHAFPIGNGRLGAMIYGGTLLDRIQLNEETLWSGQPETIKKQHDIQTLKQIQTLISSEDFSNAQQKTEESMFNVVSQVYMPAGEILVELDQPRTPFPELNSYKRELDIENAIYNSEYSLDENKIFKEAFVSAPDNVLVYNIKTQTPLSMNIYNSCMLKSFANAHDDVLEIDGICPTKADWGLDGRPLVFEYDETKESIHFRIKLKIVTDASRYWSSGNGLRLECATNTTLYISIQSSFNGYNKMPESEGKDYLSLCEKDIENISSYSYDELKSRHIEDYRSLFNRVSFKLGEYNDIPTDKRIANAEKDLNLTELLFDFGRYLIISCSRQNSQPATLQGIWSNMIMPLWHSNYTMNINTQMNYWHVETCNLPECHIPLMKMLREFCEKGNNFGFSGWASWHNSDIWRFNHEATNCALWGYWIMGGFWTCRHIWEHYLHTQDKLFLEENIDILEKAIAFLKDWMIIDKDGYYSTSPSVSPENTYVHNKELISVCEGSAMDMAIIRDLVENTISAYDILGRDSSEYNQILSKLKPVIIGMDGTILEWGKEKEEHELGHRHISHLYCIHPASQVNKDSEYFDAVKKSLKRRLDNGGGHTGWSNAWITNVFARLKDGEMVYHHIINMFKKSIYPNMLDAHPPFQIDGNFGICAAITEALLQSHNGYIEFLPALPEKWEKGEINGIITRGGHTVNIRWTDNSYTAQLTALNNGQIKLYNKNIKNIINNKTPVEYTADKDIFIFDAKAGQTYTIEG